MALLFPHPALSPKPPFPSTLRSTRPRRATYISGIPSLSPSAAAQSPSTSSPYTAPDGGAEVRNNKKKRNQKPSFEEQALRRWSARAPSQRASFPWQRQQPQSAHRENEAARDQEPSSATLRSIVEYFDYDPSDDGGVDVQGNGEEGKGKDSVALGEAAQDRDEESRPQLSYLLGSRPVSAPWMHGQEGPTVVDRLVSGPVGGDDEEVDRNGVLHDELGSVDEDEEWVDDGEVSEEDSTTGNLEGELYEEDSAMPTANSSLQLDSILDRGSTGAGFDRSIRRSSVSSIVNTLRDSMEESGPSAIGRSDAEDFVQKLGPVLLPWEREEGDVFDGYRRGKHSNAELAERTIPEQ